MLARLQEFDRQWRLAPGQPQVETHHASVLLDVVGAHIGRAGQAVGDHGTTHIGHQLGHVRVIDAQHGHTEERQVVKKFQERFLQPVETALIGVQVVPIDIGHHRDDRLQQQERSIGLVGLGHQVASLAQSGIGAKSVDQPADDKGRIHPGAGQQAGDQRGGGGLAVRAGYRDAGPEAHQFAEHFGTRHHRYATRACRQQLRIVRGDRAGAHHHVGMFDQCRIVADRNAYADLAQMIEHHRVVEIRSADIEAQIGQHFGDTAHPGAADAYEMNPAYAMHQAGHGTFGRIHANTSAHARAT